MVFDPTRKYTLSDGREWLKALQRRVLGGASLGRDRENQRVYDPLTRAVIMVLPVARAMRSVFCWVY